MDISKALEYGYPGTEWVNTDGTLAGLVWKATTPKPTKAQIDAAWALAKIAMSWDALREERDARISATDWRFMSDMIPSPAWVAYRKALRDLPANTVYPLNTVWPIKPK